MANLFVVRHGETECNRDGILQGPRIDGGLSDAGRAQAEALHRAFEATPFDTLFVSPMRRARDTAAALSGKRPVSVQAVPELYEMDFGDLCGRPSEDAKPVLADLAHAWSLGFVHRALPGGESPVLVQHRLRTFVRRLRALDSDAVVVAHGRVNRILLSTLLGVPLSQAVRFPQDNASISHVVREGDRFVVRRLNDTTHLAS